MRAAVRAVYDTRLSLFPAAVWFAGFSLAVGAASSRW
jgi:hypothetical protein